MREEGGGGRGLVELVVVVVVVLGVEIATVDTGVHDSPRLLLLLPPSLLPPCCDPMIETITRSHILHSHYYRPHC